MEDEELESPEKQQDNPDYTAGGSYTPGDVSTQQVSKPAADPYAKATELQNRLFSMREAAPTPDVAKEARLQRMGRLNAIGQTVGVLGNMLSLGMGGQVKRSAPDQTAPALYSQYSSLIDKDRADQEAWKHRDFEQQINNLRMGLGSEQEKIKAGVETQRYNTQQARLNLKHDEETAKDKRDYQFRLDTQKNTKDFQDKEIGYHNTIAKADLIRASKESAAQEKLNKSISYLDVSGKRVDIPAEFHNHYSDLAKQNFAKLKEMYPGMVTEEQSVDGSGSPIPGKFVRKSNLKPEDYIIAGHKIAQQQPASIDHNSEPKGIQYTTADKIPDANVVPGKEDWNKYEVK